MPYYITYGEFQKQMKEYYLRTGNRMQFPEMSDYLYRKGLLKDTPPEAPASKEMFGNMTDEEFDRIVDSLVLTLTPNQAVNSKVAETDIIPKTRDVFIIRHPRYTRPSPHTHNYFEIDYVVQGICTFVFENTSRVMKEG